MGMSGEVQTGFLVSRARVCTQALCVSERERECVCVYA